MAYSVDNPPALLTQRVGGSGGIWHYSSNDDAATVVASGYFTNGKDLGMKKGDVVYIFEEDTATLTTAVVSSVAADGTVDLS